MVTVLRGVTVVDTRDGSLTPGMDITIHGDRITAITPTTGEPDPDTQDRYVVPGFNDMHTHPLNAGDPTGSLELYLSRGVTGFRQMSGTPDLLARRAGGTLNLPATGPQLLTLCGEVLTPFNAATEEAAVATVNAQHKAGADFIKAALIPSPIFYAAQKEANRLSLPLAGHLPPDIDVRRVAREGMRCIEHIGPGLALFVACSTDEDALHADLAAQKPIRIPKLKLPFMDRIIPKIIAKLVMNPTARTGDADLARMRRAVDTFDEGKAQELAALFASTGVWHCPTLIRERTSQVCDDPDYSADPNLRYVDAKSVKAWTASAGKFARRPANDRQTFHDNYELTKRLTRIFDDAGVGMIAGSDACGAIWQVPGYSLHQEFDELAAAGLSPLRVLQMTTLDAAAFLERTPISGTVAVGSQADLVLLEQNPVADVAALHGVVGVVRAGRHFRTPHLEAIRTRIAAARSAF